MRPRQKLIAGVAGGLGLLAGWFFNGSLQKKTIEQIAVPVSAEENSNKTVDKHVQKVTEKKASYSEYTALIPGTWTLDVDTGKLPMGPAENIIDWANKYNLKLRYNPRDLRFGADVADSDIFIRNISRTNRYISPQHGAELHNFGKVVFESINLDTLMNAEYSDKEISASDGDYLAPGSVIGVKTNSGNLAKLRVDEYLPLGREDSDIKKHNIKCTVGLYRLTWGEQKKIFRQTGEEHNEIF
ncbi:hypothetical protein KY312_02985 [Candidatus Woesearchaeota archaeon]|nr:hypothetical protein [Candidatus Woesearchaeota archaeon]